METRRLEVDRATLQQAAALRLFAGVLAGLGGVWLLCVTSAWLLRATGLASLTFAALWARAQLRILRAAPGSADYLEAGERHLAIVHDGTARNLPLASVQQVEIDNDRLNLVLHLDGGEQLRVEPRYRGVGLQELSELIHAAVRGARAATEDARG